MDRFWKPFADTPVRKWLESRYSPYQTAVKEGNSTRAQEIASEFVCGTWKDQRKALERHGISYGMLKMKDDTIVLPVGQSSE
jgi:hypothetical protein